MRPSFLALGLTGLLVGLLASPATLRGDPEVLRLTEPRLGEVWQGGGQVWLDWQAARISIGDSRGPGLALPADAHEWEAFLSLDGGATFPLRITPHLDLDRRRFAFRVPNLTADDVRLLLRAGNERQEVSVPVAGSWRIAADPLRTRERSVVWSRRPGEKARPQDSGGVVAWVEETADGEVEEHRQLPGAGWRRYVAPGASMPSLLSDPPQPRPRPQGLPAGHVRRQRRARIHRTPDRRDDVPPRLCARLLEARFNE